MQTLSFPPSSTSTARTSALALALGLMILTLYPTWTGLALAASVGVGVVAAWVDVRTHRLPDLLVGLVAAPAVLAGLVGTTAGLTVGVTSAGVLAGALVFAVPVFLVHVVCPTAMGFGDVKFAGSLGAAIGLIDPAWALVALCLASGATATFGMARRSAIVPFGPGLVGGAVVAVVAPAVSVASIAGGGFPW